MDKLLKSVSVRKMTETLSEVEIEIAIKEIRAIVRIYELLGYDFLAPYLEVRE